MTDLPCPGVQRGVQLLLQRDVDRAEAGDTRNLPHRLQLYILLTGAIIIPSYHVISWHIYCHIIHSARQSMIPVNLELVNQLWLPNIFIYNLKTFKVTR